MTNTSRDSNRVPTLLGVSSLDLLTPTTIAVNPTTGAMLIDGTSLYVSLDTRYPLKTNVLELNNTTVFTPDANYEPATKKYVDDTIGVENLWDRTGTVLTPHTAGDTATVNITGSASLNVLKAGDTMTGGLTIAPSTDVTTALVVNDKDANNVLTVDTINNRVGINTSTPSTMFEIVGDGISPIVTTIGYGTSAGAEPGVVYLKANGSKASPTQLLSSDNIGVFSFRGYHSGGAFTGSRAKILAAAEENWTSTNQGARIVFQGTPAGSTTLASLMTIKGSGNVGIGTTTPTAKLHIVGGANTQQLIVKGNATQTANLQEWQNSSGTILLSIDASGNLVFGETKNIILGTTTGSKIGTATNQLLGFFNATPVVQQTGCAVPTDLATCIMAITALRTALNNLGLTTVV